MQASIHTLVDHDEHDIVLEDNNINAPLSCNDDDDEEEEQVQDNSYNTCIPYFLEPQQEDNISIDMIKLYQVTY
jgi:hypothetical protein